MKMRSLVGLLCLLWFTAAKAEVNMIYVSTETYFKKTTAQASSLPAASKCLVRVGQAFETGAVTASSGHYQVALKKSIPGCGFATGYFYDAHTAKSNTAITVHRATVFKKTAADSSTLPASSKCDMPIGVYRLSGSVSDSGSHYRVNLAAFLPNCGFSQGYVYEEHSISGIQAVTLFDSAYFKTSTADSSTLPASSKCLIAAGNYTLAAPADAEGTHYRLTMAKAISGCGFQSGFMFHANTSLADPGNASSTNYTFPLEGGVLGSGWCVCRSVGTSPHIGQDTYTLSGTMRAVAIANGVVDDRFFDASCGNFLVIRDDGGALWRYVHLNTPSVSIGQRVTAGQQLATISSYPTSSCGTGPHLHYERRSAGAFADSAVGKDCGQGYKSCNYDPLKPFRNASTAASAKAAVPLQAAQSPLLDNVDQEVRPVLACRYDPKAYSKADTRNVAGAAEAKQSGIRTQLSFQEREGFQVAVASAAFADNPQNVCNASKGRNCIVSWSLLSETRDGSWRRVFHDPAVQNNAPARVAEEAFCQASQSTGRSMLILRDLRGNRYVSRFENTK
jgi:murein DD-endopeptidase MepM/ murein hydrolase activator NlpD